MLFLIVPCVIAVVPGDEDEAGESGMDEFPMAALASRHAQEPGIFQIRNKLANLAGHMTESVTGATKLRALLQQAVLLPPTQFFGIRFSV
jgi:hypothetical protein